MGEKHRSTKTEQKNKVGPGEKKRRKSSGKVLPVRGNLSKIEKKNGGGGSPPSRSKFGDKERAVKRTREGFRE